MANQNTGKKEIQQKLHEDTNTRESLGLYKLKQHKPWFDEECLRFLDQRKQAKMQWLQHPDQSNVDNT